MISLISFLFSSQPNLQLYKKKFFNFYRPLIREKLQSGVSLVVDRYSYSGVAFSAAKEVNLSVLVKVYFQFILSMSLCFFFIVRTWIYNGAGTQKMACQPQMPCSFWISVNLLLRKGVALETNDMRCQTFKQKWEITTNY